MYILVTNDDGYTAPGIAALIDAVRDLGNFCVVAPVNNHSGASSSLTLSNDIQVYPKGDHFYAVSGTPTDCVHLALSGDFLPQQPDLIISGINDGANMGDDTIYSGTVAAAIEGHLFHIPAFAFSMTQKSSRYLTTGAAVARDLVQRFLRHGGSIAPAPLYNVNIPDLPAHELSGTVCTRLGRRHVAEPAVCLSKTADCLTYQIGEAGEALDDAEGTDFAAVRAGYVSVTPLMVDLTAVPQIAPVRDWLAK